MEDVFYFGNYHNRQLGAAITTTRKNSKKCKYGNLANIHIFIDTDTPSVKFFFLMYIFPNQSSSLLFALLIEACILAEYMLVVWKSGYTLQFPLPPTITFIIVQYVHIL